MDYELTMLINAQAVKQRAQKLTTEATKLALGSFGRNKYCNNTLQQMEGIMQVVKRRDLCALYYAYVWQALRNTSKGYRVLLAKIYLQNVSKQTIAQTYNVSLSTVYRKLSRARKVFRRQLEMLGCTEQWFCDNFCCDATPDYQNKQNHPLHKLRAVACLA